MSLVPQCWGSQPAPPWGRAQSSPMALHCPKPSLPTNPDTAFPTSEAHPGTGRAPQQSAELRPSRRSLFGTGRPHPPHQHTQSPTAAGVLQAKTQFPGCLQHREFPSLQFLPPCALPWRSGRVLSDGHSVPGSSLCCAAPSPQQVQPHSWKRREGSMRFPCPAHVTAR